MERLEKALAVVQKQLQNTEEKHEKQRSLKQKDKDEIQRRKDLVAIQFLEDRKQTSRRAANKPPQTTDEAVHTTSTAPPISLEERSVLEEGRRQRMEQYRPPKQTTTRIVDGQIVKEEIQEQRLPRRRDAHHGQQYFHTTNRHQHSDGGPDMDAENTDDERGTDGRTVSDDTDFLARSEELERANPIDFNVSKERQCCSCQIRERKVAIVPCGHLCCLPCGFRLKNHPNTDNRKCPVCRTLVTQAVEMFE